MGRGWASVATTCVMVLVASSSLAADEPSEAERGAARELVYSGDRLAEGGNHQAALERYLAADEIMGVPSTGIEVARSYEKLGRLIEAKAKADEVASYPRRDDEPAPFTEARLAATQLSKALGKRIPNLTIELTGVAPSDVVIRVDGIERGDGPIDPGDYLVRAEAVGYAPASEKVTIADGDDATVTLELSPIAAEGGIDGFDVMAVAGFSLGGVGLVVGVVTGGLSWSATSSLKERCDGGRCPVAEEDELSRANTLATVSDVSFVVMGVGVAVGVLGVLLSLGDEDEERAAAWHVDPNGLTMRF